MREIWHSPRLRAMLATLGITLLVIAPLLAYVLRNGLPWGRSALVFAAVLGLWFVTYAPLHELTHMLALFMAGGSPAGWRFVPRYWTGDFRSAFVTARDLTDSQTLVTVAAPYVRDLLLAPAGAVLLAGGAARRLFPAALLLAVACLGSVYDVASNFWGYLRYDAGDFAVLARVAGPGWAVGLGVAATAAGVIGGAVALRRRPADR
ncbi:MAG TPA: hypothetical protein VF832_12005, partial [Longimicrobiales bacterium]